MKILSLFDGMACGYIAMLNAGVEIESYDAYEIDKYAIQTATHNFPQIVEHGDVFNADFTQYAGVDFLIGGSPCTHWSIAQTQNRETTVSRDEKGRILLHSSGIGFELFSQYLRALDEAKPKYFIYENNKSMSKEIRAAITECFGFEPVCINSALVSAQNRQRLYWVGIRNADGTYSKVHVEQPEDRGILLKDVLDSAVAWREKAYTIDANYYKTAGVYDPKKQHAYSRLQDVRHNYERHQRSMVAVPVGVRQVGRRVGEDGHRHDYDESIEHEQRFEVNEDPQKTNCISTVSKDSMAAEPINVTEDGKSQTLKAQYVKNNVENFCCYTSTYGASDVAEPVCLRYERTEDAKRCRKAYEAHEIHHGYNELNELHPRPDGKTNTLTTVQKDNMVAEPIRCMNYELKEAYDSDSGCVARLDMPNSKTRRGRNMADKSNCMQTSNEFYQYVGYAIEFDENGKPIKAIGKDGKQITVYEVRDGKITIKGKQYPIKLVDGYYIIRKLTVSECKRLQTVPEWYEFPVSDSRALKMLGNGWTCDIISFLIQSVLSEVLL